LKVVKLYKLILIRYTSSVMEIVWNLTFRKLKLYLSHAISTVSILITSDVLILHSNCIKDLGVMLDSKLDFHFHVDFVYS
jgi:hypothetical protein